MPLRDLAGRGAGSSFSGREGRRVDYLTIRIKGSRTGMPATPKVLAVASWCHISLSNGERFEGLC